MQSWNAYSYAFGPVIALAVFGVLVLLLRWAFGRGQSLVPPPARPGTQDAYGLLVPVAAPATFIEGEVLRRTLEDAGIRATLATTLDGPRVLVFPDDEPVARSLLPPGPGPGDRSAGR